MNNKILILPLVLAAAFALFGQPLRAQAPEGKFRAGLLGYRMISLKQHTFSHNTHPDDSFLPDAHVPGSAGTTDIGNKQHFMSITLGWQPRLSDCVSLNFDAGILLGDNRDRHQNANDDRLPGNAAFVYSQARFGALAAAGMSYHFKHFLLGVETQLASVLVEHGWDRYGSDKNQTSKVHHMLSAGPKAGIRAKPFAGGSTTLGLECTLQFNHAVTFGIQGVLGF
ncbi:hypothetical protein M2103_002092 [Ereboglobus sp. PH5-5]|uniref:hypothetical protein n=1 Tax=Ereboglobus sp. PH5-5 TaxID=2940529 RepID=UPI00240677A1|nr:hypothetical protein [Ereboglobus sp. PH5-5]MDF9833859.1 hypothetical protein [Ereboglobus sp. PH5-5]